MSWTSSQADHGDRFCLRGCVRKDVHFASCAGAGCDGCAPRSCRDGSLICDSCFGRMRGLLGEVRDMVGRLTAIADPLKASVLDQIRVRVSSGEPASVVSSDLLDALGTLNAVQEWAYVDLATVANDRDTILSLCEYVLERHPEVDGVRDAWSVQDVKDRWGVERRTNDVFTFPEEDDEIEVTPIHEWYDPLLTLRQAAERRKLTQRAVQKWVEKKALIPTAKLRENGQTVSYFRASDVDAVAKEMEARRANRAHEFARS